MVYAGMVSSGLNKWPTYEGLFQVWERNLTTDMVGAEGRVDYYVVEDVPHTMYFDFDIALHGAYWHDRFGYKHSHGCVNMPPRDAEWVFNWSENAPNDLWVWVHTSDPHNLVPTDRLECALHRTVGISRCNLLLQSLFAPKSTRAFLLPRRGRWDL